MPNTTEASCLDLNAASAASKQTTPNYFANTRAACMKKKKPIQ